MATAYPQSPDELKQQLPKYSENVSSLDPSNVVLTGSTANSNADSSENKCPPAEKECKDKIDLPLNAGLPNTTARANMPGFMFETKYIMLNFMSLIPPDLYAGHLSSSPDSLASSDISTSDNLTKSNPLFTSRGHSLSKSQSLDTGLQRSYPKLKHIHKLKHFQQSIESPASDDNLNYKYQLNCEKLVSPEGVKSYSGETSNEHSDVSNGIKSHTVDSSHDDHSSSSSPRKRSLYRMASDVSSSGDFSYISDADDEYEDYSNASSIFSARGLTCRDGFLDLRSAPRLSTLRSESESLDEPDTCNNPRLSRHDLQDVPEEQEVSDSANVKQEQTSESALEVQDARADLYAASQGVDGSSWCSRRQAADRSKLTLDIPCPPVQLSDILVSLQTDLNSEMSELETEYEEAVRSARENMRQPCATPLTPQTQAARILARMGDEVKAQYGNQISSAVNKYLLQKTGKMSYKLFKEIAQEVVDLTLPGWRQVALLLVFGQRVLWSSVQRGNKQVEDIIEYCSQLVADVAAEFIIKQGGWGSVMNSDPSLSSESFSSTTDADSPPCVVEYFASHDITQVESKQEVTADDGENTVTGDDVSDTSARADEPGRSPNIELGEGWDENREAVTEGVTFYLKYLGSYLLEELPVGESYGEGVSSKAVQRIVDMAKTVGKRLTKVSLTVSPHGIQVADMETKEMLLDVTIYRISFCTADKYHSQVFAFMARNTINETMECHAFYCAKQKIAQAVTLSVSQAFQLAKDQWENAKNKKKSINNQSNKDQKQLENTKNQQESESNFRKIQSAPQIDLLKDTHSRLPKPESAKSLCSQVRSDSPQHRVGWQTFDDEGSSPVKFSNDGIGDNENLDDWFSQLAEDRSRKPSFSTFSTDLCKEDLDDSVEDYMDGTKSLEAFSKSRSVEDLLNI